MTPPLLTGLREHSKLTRSISLFVLITFLMLILEPLAVAAQNNHPPQQATPAAPSDSQRFSKTLQTFETKLQKLSDKLSQSQDAGSDLADLKALHQTLQQLDRLERQSFTKIAQHLKDHNLPAEIEDRHRAMLENYQTEFDALNNELTAIEAAANDTERRSHVQIALERLKTKQNAKKQQPFDPKQLPNQGLKANPNNKPKETPAQFTQAKLFDTPYPQLAALGDFTYDKLAGASNPAYLAESDEVVLSEAVKAKAAELQYDPVKIYQWVRNNIVWLPSWGGIQNADLTLSVQRGNAMDIAGLTIALLRASKIPARYVHGTIDVPADAFNNWAGGFSNINAAADYAATGGIPVTSVVSGGQIAQVRLEHLWVEAAIDFYPSRGAKNKDADSWVSLDPSYKQYDYQKGLDAVAISGIDPNQLAQNFVASGTVNDAEGWATGFDAQLLQDAQTQAQQKLQDYINTQMQNPTVGDVIGGAKTIIQAFPTLPSSLPNRIVTAGGRYDHLPSTLQQHIVYSFGTDMEGNQIDPVDFPFAKVNNQKLTLSFKPATAADEQTLQSLLPDGEITDISQLPSSIPSYLINVIPELKLNGQTVKAGSTMKLGEELPFVTAVTFAGRGLVQNPRTYNVIAGSYLSVNAIAGNVSPSELNKLKATLEQTKTKLESQDQTQIAALTREELLGDLFRTGSLGYYAEFIGLNHIMGLQSGGHYQLAAGTGTVGYEPKVSYFFGIPKAIEPGGVVFDIPLFNIAGVNDGDPAKKKQFVLQTGILSSTLEYAVPEQMFVNAQNPGEAISAVKALQKANQQGQRIYHITPDNQGATLANIHHDSATMEEIRNVLYAGKEVITHTDAVSVSGWSGAGYIILDPATGDGAYKIGGGANGAFLMTAWGILLHIGSIFTSLARDHPVAATILGIVLTALAIAGVGGVIVIALSVLATITNLAVSLETSGVICGGVIGSIVVALTAFSILAKNIPAFLIANATNAYGSMGDCPI